MTRTSAGTGAPASPALGHILALLTAGVGAVAFICAKPVLEFLDPASFTFGQFGFAALFAGVWLLVRGKTGDLRALTRRHWAFLAGISLLFLSAIYTFWVGLARIPVTSASLLNRLEVLLIVLLGMAFLGDRFTRREAAGAAIMFLGVVVIRYQAPPSFSAGFWMVVLSSALFAVTEILVKTAVFRIPPDAFTFVRNVMVVLLLMVVLGWRAVMGDAGAVPDFAGIRRGWPLIAIAALTGPFGARTLFLYCLRHLEVSRASLIQQIQPVFVAVFSAVVLHTLPNRREWAGGVLIIAGALLLVSWRVSRRGGTPPGTAGGGRLDP